MASGHAIAGQVSVEAKQAALEAILHSDTFARTDQLRHFL